MLARNKLRKFYIASDLRFTFDGNLVGDLGEAIAAELFDIALSSRNEPGIDGHAHDGRTVQVKATGVSNGPSFRNTDSRADHLLFFDLDFDSLKGTVVYNGPEEIALQWMPETWNGQKEVTMKRILEANRQVEDNFRLPRADK